jgi:hypothetical protein
MSTLPRAALLLLAVTACADPTAPTAPSAAASREPLLATGPWRPGPPVRTLTFTKTSSILSGRVDAVASALPGGPTCDSFATDDAQYVLNIDGPTWGHLYLALLDRRLVRIEWETERTFNFTGYTKIREEGHAEGAGRVLHTYSELEEHRGLTQVVDSTRFRSALLTARDLGRLDIGSVLRVFTHAEATATVDVFHCGANVQGAQAIWRVKKVPVLNIY